MKRFVGAVEVVLLFLLALLLVRFIGPPAPPASAQTAPPPHWFEQGAPPWDADLVLPDTSDRIANYTMHVRLDTATNIISGSALLEWRNTTGQPQRSFPFHLYHNAWKNNRSSYAKEGGWSLWRPAMRQEDYGYTNIRRAVWIANGREIDITGSFRYVQPDDNNSDDHTVCELSTPTPIPAGATLSLRLDFETKQPLPISRTGAIRNYHFVAQWFPKIGVWWKGEWNCHQFHAHTEYFADFGNYDVSITVPDRYVVGASGGVAYSITPNEDSTTTHRFKQNDIHDFAWVTSPDLEVSIKRFSHVKADPDERRDRHHPLKEVDVIVMTQPHRAHMADRYFDATFQALRFYGEWYGEYPYNAVTVVDPANGSASGGMEYPTIFTGGTSMFAPREQSSPEGVTVHEFGHQFWYGLVATNEFEEAWLDEGLNTYSTDRVMRHAWKPFKNVRFYFGGMGAGEYVGIPWVFDVDELELIGETQALRRQGKNDVMARRGWEYNETYGLNSYEKPALSLIMLENILGEEMMYRVMRTFHHRFRFKHPTTEDFIQTVNTVTQKDYRWFFENTWFSSDLFDYAVDRISNIELSQPNGYFTFNGTPVDSAALPNNAKRFHSEVIVVRKGEAKAPVEVLVEFEDGTTAVEQWDGQYRWTRFSYDTDHRVVKAIVDPNRKLVMDINWNNNSAIIRPAGYRSLSAQKYAAGVLFWIQNFLEMAL